LDDGATIDRVMKAGADAYIVKSISAQEMLDAIRAVQAGQFVIARPKDGGLADSHYPPLEIDDVTGRQQQVLALLVNGKTNKEIARALSISPLTVRNHVSILLKAFKVRSRWQLKAKASLQDASSELP
jgi:DNA-binding NarL/FixJ family response regulator